MQGQKSSHAPENSPNRFVRFLANPSASVEVVLWILLIATAFGIRAYLVHLLPVVLWSDDAQSYAASAFKWVHSGVWSTDPRRGPIYSLFIAACAKATGNIDSVMLMQHVLGGVAVVLAMIALRVLYDRRALVPIALCSYAYTVYGLPIYLEQLMRNETLLFFFGTVAFVSWLFAIRFEKPHWLWISGIAAALLMLTKNVFGPFPLVVVAGHIFYWRSTPKLAVKYAVIFSVAFALPLIGVRVLKQLTVHNRPPEPQAGILLYGRTAQFTYLEGGIEPEIKEQIRKEVEDYRKLPRLDNNLILKRTIVPHLQRILTAQKKKPADLEKLCRRLAFEGIAHHKWAYVKQVLHDLERVHTKGGYRFTAPDPKDLQSVASKLSEREHTDPLMRVDETIAALESRLQKKRFSFYVHWTKSGWLFRFVPVLFTTLFLPILIYFTRSKIQLWWIGAGAVWFFTMVLLCTVGRPLDRYLIPAASVMFWTLSATFIFLWQWTLARVAERLARQNDSDASSAPSVIG